jgi:hypothetical protein
MRRIAVQGQPGQKNISKTVSQPTTWLWWHVPVIPATQDAQVGGLQSEAGPG